MIRRYAIAMAFGTLSPLAASAAEGAAAPGLDQLSYSYFQAHYLNSSAEAEPDNGCPAASCEEEGEGLGFGLSVSLMDYFYFSGSYDQRAYGREILATTPTAPGAGDPTRWVYGSAGFGVHTIPTAWPNLESLQFYGVASYERAELHDRDDSTKDETDWGWGLEGGARMPFPNVELQAYYKHFNLGDTEQNLKVFGDRYGAGVLLQLTPYLGLTGDYHLIGHRWGSDFTLTEWTVGFRAYFATDVERRRRHGGLLTGLFGD
jgi:hypothetical protein